MLRNLDDTEDDKFKVIVTADKKVAMRGLDYRAPSNGIQLLVCRSFSHQREAEQAAYRVGRQNDPCKRVILKGLALLNDKEHIDYKSNLISFISSYAPKPVMKLAKPQDPVSDKGKRAEKTSNRGQKRPMVTTTAVEGCNRLFH